MELTYSFKIQTSELEPSLKESEDKRSSDFYIDKECDWLSFDIEFNPNQSLTLLPTLYEKEIFNDRIEYKLNTLDVLLTDVKINSQLYFYKLIIQSQNKKTVEDLQLETEVNDIVEYDGVFYTNTPFYIFNKENDYIYTHPVLSVDDYKIAYDSNHILLITQPNISLKLKDKIINPQLINEHCFHIPSFYLENFKTGKITRCIESNIKEFMLENNSELNRPLKYHCKTVLKGISNLYNIIFNKDIPETLVFKTSTHYFKLLKSYEYFNINHEGGIEIGDKSNYVFKISKNLNMDKISVLVNTYVEQEEIKLNPNQYVNSLRETDSSINDYGIRYLNIVEGIPKVNYISNNSKEIYTILSSLEVDSRVTTTSMRKETTNLKSTVQFPSDTAYTRLDNIYYYSKENNNGY